MIEYPHMTSQERTGGDDPKAAGEVQQTANEVKPTASEQPTDVKAAPQPDKPNIGKILIYIIVAIILIGACSALSKEGGDGPDGEKSQDKGFFTSIFGGSDDEEDEESAGGESEVDEFILPDGKG
jgi:hypothetical protein